MFVEAKRDVVSEGVSLWHINIMRINILEFKEIKEKYEKNRIHKHRHIFTDMPFVAWSTH